MYGSGKAFCRVAVSSRAASSLRTLQRELWCSLLK